MPRKLDATMTLDTLEDEVVFTTAALQADEDTQDLVTMTETWLPQIDAVRVTDRQVRQAIANVDAGRAVTNERLDIAVIDFGDDLLTEVDKDRTDPRWTGFFSVSPSRFVRISLSQQVETVQGWLEGSTDAVLEQHREELTTRSGDAKSALVSTKALTQKRSQLWQQRTALAESLTAARDTLHEALAQRARAKKLPRTWPDAFFRIEARSETSSPPQSSTPSAP